MVLPVKVYDAEGEEFSGPYLVHMDGWTEERYLAEAPEMGFVEFADGQLIVHSPVPIRHQQIAGFLTFLLMGYVDSNGLGKVLNGPAVVRLRPGLLYEPDVFFVPRDRLQGMETQYYSGAPSLVVEILSPSTRSYDLRVKAARYQEHGVQEYWVIDSSGSLLHQHVLSLPDGGYIPKPALLRARREPSGTRFLDRRGVAVGRPAARLHGVPGPHTAGLDPAPDIPPGVHLRRGAHNVETTGP